MTMSLLKGLLIEFGISLFNCVVFSPECVMGIDEKSRD